jgi:transposase
MANITKAISDDLFILAQSALKESGKSGDVGRKLQAIISAKEHGVRAVAKIFGVSRQSLMTWIKSFAAESEDGLKIKSGRGRKRLINKEIEGIARNILQENPNTTIDHLQQILFYKHNVSVARATVHRMIKRLDLSYITPRPQHYKTDIIAQEQFKKTPESGDKIMV